MVYESDKDQKCEVRATEQRIPGEYLLRPREAAHTASCPSEDVEVRRRLDGEIAATRFRPACDTGERALERVRPLLPDLRLPPRTRADWHHAAYCADSCRVMSEVLRREHMLMVAEREAKIDEGRFYTGTYLRHF